MTADIALVLHGRVPSWRGRDLTENSADTTLLNASRRSLARFAAGNLRRRVLMPNRGLDVYVHSWNPELGAVWDALRPARVWHQPIIRGLSALRSQHLSLKRVLSLVPDSIRLMLVSRLDVLLFTDVLLRPLLHDEAVAAGHEALWLPRTLLLRTGPALVATLRR
jgi:hypothetical protein